MHLTTTNRSLPFQVVVMLKALREIAVYERTVREKRGDAVSASNASATASASSSNSSSAASASNTGRNRRNSDTTNKSTNNNNNHGSKAHGGDGGGGGQAGPSGDSEAGRVYVGHSKTLGLFTSERMRQRIEEHGEMPSDFTYFREVQPIGFTGNDPTCPPPPEPCERLDGGGDDDDQYGDGDDGTEHGDGDDSDVVLAGDRVSANPGKASACVPSPRSSKRSKGGNGEGRARRTSHRPERGSLSPSEGEALRG